MRQQHRPLTLPPRPEPFNPPKFNLPTADDILIAQEDAWRAETEREFDMRLFFHLRRFADIPKKDLDRARDRWWKIQKEALRLDEEYRIAHNGRG